MKLSLFTDNMIIFIENPRESKMNYENYIRNSFLTFFFTMRNLAKLLDIRSICGNMYFY